MEPTTENPEIRARALGIVLANMKELSSIYRYGVMHVSQLRANHVCDVEEYLCAECDVLNDQLRVLGRQYSCLQRHIHKLHCVQQK